MSLSKCSSHWNLPLCSHPGPAPCILPFLLLLFHILQCIQTKKLFQPMCHQHPALVPFALWSHGSDHHSDGLFAVFLTYPFIISSPGTDPFYLLYVFSIFWTKIGHVGPRRYKKKSKCWLNSGKQNPLPPLPCTYCMDSHLSQSELGFCPSDSCHVFKSILRGCNSACTMAVPDVGGDSQSWAVSQIPNYKRECMPWPVWLTG